MFRVKGDNPQITISSLKKDMYSNRAPLPFSRVGMQAGATTLENNMEASQKN
jgi:hypothetical protein